MPSDLPRKYDLTQNDKHDGLREAIGVDSHAKDLKINSLLDDLGDLERITYGGVGILIVILIFIVKEWLKSRKESS